ncbi:hypothetical protein RAS12_11845 [Achromobacter seleniivolatilans]|uniref:Minor tail protein n=1 Tax=Achromobacter seleniivolatilans TaxID=3047478 RepID=A0ABY9M8W6_9BURK|nr:hypothetical protein [Achromobacter sp. R39]WMD23029.1 hypothetical protein RAS12_11845 [Achromobacter sp. R39]
MQGKPQISTTPPQPGVAVLPAINEALQTIATDFSGDIDPAASAWPFSRWADTSTMLLKRRNAANTAWFVVGPLLPTRQSSLLRTVVLTTSGTWTRGAGTESVEVEIWGGGGSGIGGTNGGDSSFVAGATSLVAGGGNFGASTGSIGATTGQGGNATGGDVNIKGGHGSDFISAATGTEYSGAGGSAPRGGAGSANKDLSAQIPGGGGARTIVPATVPNRSIGGGSGGYAYKFVASAPASAAVVIGAGGVGVPVSASGAQGQCVVKEYGRM